MCFFADPLKIEITVPLSCNFSDAGFWKIEVTFNGQHVVKSPCSLITEIREGFSDLDGNGDMSRNKNTGDLDQSELKAMGYIDQTTLAPNKSRLQADASVNSKDETLVNSGRQTMSKSMFEERFAHWNKSQSFAENKNNQQTADQSSIKADPLWTSFVPPEKLRQFKVDKNVANNMLSWELPPDGERMVEPLDLEPLERIDFPLHYQPGVLQSIAVDGGKIYVTDVQKNGKVLVVKNRKHGKKDFAIWPKDGSRFSKPRYVTCFPNNDWPISSDVEDSDEKSGTESQGDSDGVALRRDRNRGLDVVILGEDKFKMYNSDGDFMGKFPSPSHRYRGLACIDFGGQWRFLTTEITRNGIELVIIYNPLKKGVMRNILMTDYDCPEMLQRAKITFVSAIYNHVFMTDIGNGRLLQFDLFGGSGRYLLFRDFFLGFKCLVGSSL